MATASLKPTLEDLRMAKVLAMLPGDLFKVLEIGARHGVMTRKLAQQVGSVTALDLSMPKFQIDGVTNAAGNVERLAFEDDSFDCIVCTEVLEHVPDLQSASRELTRVARKYVLIGVPYRQDTRVDRTTCIHCGHINPPYGHLNTFDEARLAALFPTMKNVSIEYLAENTDRTNALSVWLQDLAGNPYGVYDQEEPCVKCNHQLLTPSPLPPFQKAAAAIGVRLYYLQKKFNKPLPTWILLLLKKV